MKKYKYISKNKKNSLMNEYSSDDLKEKIIIQSSDFNHVLLFESINNFLEFHNNLKKEERIYYEVILSDDKQKFKLDIDIKNKKYDKNTDICYINENIQDNFNINELINDCIDSIFKIINCNKFKYYIFDSSNIDKYIISKHIIFDFYIYSSYDAKILYDVLINRLSIKYNKQILDLIDNSVYKTIQCFRLPYHTKINEERYKICKNEYNLNIIKGMIKNYNIEYIHCINISKLLNNNNINSIDEHCVPHTNQKLNNNITDNNEVVSIDENILKEILENTKEYLINFKVRNIISNKIIFDRIKGGYCDICERIHENENSSYIILYDNIYRLYCRRNENKYIEFSLKTKNNSIKLNKYLILKNNIKYNNMILIMNLQNQIL